MSVTSPTVHRIDSSSRLRLGALESRMEFDREAFREFQSRRARSMPAAVVEIHESALTPWDMIDDEASEEGVTFSRFQYFSTPHHSGN